MHILLIRLSSIGDVVLQTSLIAALKRQFGARVKISFLVGAEFADLLNGHPMIEQVLTFDRKKQSLSAVFMDIIRLHQISKIDCIIDLHGSLRSSLIRYRFFYIPSIVVDKRKIERFCLIYLKINSFKKYGVIPSLVERILSDFSGVFNYSTDRLEISQYLKHQTGDSHRLLGTITSTADAFKQSANLNIDSGTIVFAPSASFENKRWPAEYFLQLAELLINQRHEKIVILAGPKDSFCQAFDQLCNRHPDRISNLQGKTSLLESNQLIAQSKLVIGNDTGLVHIAESYGVSVLVLYGPTSESFGFIPHGPHSKYLSVNLWCRPCSPTGKGKCFRAKRYCMLNLTPDIVFGHVCSILSPEVQSA